MITDKPVQYNNDVMDNILRYLPLNELFAMSHTNKHFRQLLNNFKLNDLSESFDIKPVDNFMALMNQLIYDKYKYDMTKLHSLEEIKKKEWWHATPITSYNEIYKAFLKNEFIYSCKTRRTTNTPLCQAKYYLRKNYAKEIDQLNASKNDYQKNLNHLEYAIYYNLLSQI